MSDIGDRFVCSDASEGRGETVVATASPVRNWLLIEVPGAWGADAIHESALGLHVPAGWKADLQRRGIRPVCIRTGDRGGAPSAARVFFVITARPGRTVGSIWSRSLPTVAALPYVTDRLQAGSAPPEGWAAHPDRVVIVCTNGRHDQCCANRGRPIARRLRESRWAEQIWECSHIGGDRFAANVVVLPDGLYYGRMEPAEAELLLDEHAAGRIALEWYRGRSTLRFVEQAAEHAVRTGFGVLGVDDVEVVGPAPDNSRIRVRVRDIGTVDVVMERTTVRTADPLTCRGPGDQEFPHHAAVRLIEVPNVAEKTGNAVGRHRP